MRNTLGSEVLGVESTEPVLNSLFFCAFDDPSLLSKSVAELALPMPAVDDEAASVLAISGQLSASSSEGGELDEDAANRRAELFEGMRTTNGSSTILLDAPGTRSSGSWVCAAPSGGFRAFEMVFWVDKGDNESDEGTSEGAPALACPCCDRAICSLRAVQTLEGVNFEKLLVAEAVCCSSMLVWEDDGGGDPGRVSAAVELGVRFRLDDAGELGSSTGRAALTTPLGAGRRVFDSAG